MHDYFKILAMPYLKNKITISMDEIEAIGENTTRMIPSLLKNPKYQHEDPKVLWKTFNNGKISEVGIEKLTKTKFVNFEIRNPEEPDKGDLYYYDNLKIGVKSSEYGNLPLVFRKDRFAGPKDPEIMTIFERPNFVYICGYASLEMVKYYQDTRFAFNGAEKKKAGFWGFHKLVEFKTMSELKLLNLNKELIEYNKFSDKPEDYGFRKQPEIIDMDI